MKWIYLSPHLDDIALSCGGLVWEQSQAGAAVSIWTICAGDPPGGSLSAFAASLHARWQTQPQAAQERRQEDFLSCQQMGADYRHFTVPDCIYRRGPEGEFLYDSEESLFGELHPQEQILAANLADQIAAGLAPEDQLVSPLTLGHHVDHQLTRAAAERLGQSLWYYEDYPYAEKASQALAALGEAGWKPVVHAVSPAGIRAWQASIAAHRSQISTFWPDLETMQSAVQRYYQQRGGICLWRLEG